MSYPKIIYPKADVCPDCNVDIIYAPMIGGSEMLLDPSSLEQRVIVEQVDGRYVWSVPTWLEHKCLGRDITVD